MTPRPRGELVRLAATARGADRRAGACLARAAGDLAAGRDYQGLAMAGRARVILGQQAADAEADAVRVHNADLLGEQREQRVEAARPAARAAMDAAGAAAALLESAVARTGPGTAREP